AEHGVDETGDGRDAGDEPGPARQLPERVVGDRPDASAVAAVEDLGLVPRHVDPRRAVAGARLAREAQVEGGVDGGAADVGDEAAVGRRLQGAGTPPGDVLLIPRRLV